MIGTYEWVVYNLMFISEHFIGLKLSNLFFKKLRKKIVEKVEKIDNIHSRGEIIPIEDIEYASFEEFKLKNPKYFTSLAVFRGITKDWPSTQKWNKDFFKTNYGSTQINMIDNKGLVDPEVKNEFKETNFKNYFDEVETDKSKYLRFSRILDHNPELLKDLDLKWLEQFNGGKKDGGTYMFIGEGGTKTPMHAAIAHTVFIQVNGVKKWTIYAPNERFFLEVKAERFPYFRTDANPNIKDDPEHPLLKYARKYEIILEEGDILWMPSFYWHYVENQSSNIGVAYKFARPLDSFKISKVLTTLTFLQTKPPLIVYYFYNLFKKQEYQFSKKSSYS